MRGGPPSPSPEGGEHTHITPPPYPPRTRPRCAHGPIRSFWRKRSKSSSSSRVSPGSNSNSHRHCRPPPAPPPSSRSDTMAPGTMVDSRAGSQICWAWPGSLGPARRGARVRARFQCLAPPSRFPLPPAGPASVPAQPLCRPCLRAGPAYVPALPPCRPCVRAGPALHPHAATAATAGPTRLSTRAEEGVAALELDVHDDPRLVEAQRAVAEAHVAAIRVDQLPDVRGRAVRAHEEAAGDRLHGRGRAPLVLLRH